MGGTFTKFKRSRYASEFVGTFILVASIKLIVSSGEGYGALGVGVTLMMIVYHYGYISLAMFNPAVTIGQIIRNSESFRRNDCGQWFMYLICQFSGGILGGCFSALVGGKSACNVYTYVNADIYEPYEAFFAELFYCTILVSINLHLAADKRTSGNQMYGIAIGGVLMISAMSIGNISGSAINPAVWLGTVLSASMCLSEGESLKYMEYSWVYWISHLLAGLIAGIWFNMIYGGDEADGIGNENETKKEMQQLISDQSDDDNE